MLNGESGSRWRALLGAAVFALFLLYAATQREALATIWQRAHAPYLVLLGLLAALALWTQGKTFQRSCREFGTPLGEREAFALAVLTTAGNYVGVVRLGSVAKAVYLKRARGLPITDTVAILGGNSIVMALTGVSCGLLLLLYLRAWQTPAGVTAGVALALLLVLLLAVLMAPRAAVDGLVQRVAPRFARARLERLVHAWSIVGRRHLLYSLLLWNLAIYATAAMAFYTGFTLLLGDELSVGAALAFTVFTGLASLVSLTPGNLGLQEFLIVALAHSFQLGQDAGVVVAAALRVVQIIVVVALLPITWPLVGRDLFRPGDAPPAEPPPNDVNPSRSSR